MLRIAILRILESYFKHRWLYFLPIIILGAIGGYYVSQNEDEYIAGGVMYVQSETFLAALTSVQDSGISWWVTPAQFTIEEIDNLLLTEAFMTEVINKTSIQEEMAGISRTERLEIIQEARDAIWTGTIGDSQIFINAVHTEPEISYELVNSVIDTYIQWRINRDRTEGQVAQEFFVELTEQYLQELEATRDELQAYLESHPEPIRGERPDVEILEINRLQNDLELAGTRYSRALEKDENARLALAQTESNVRQSLYILDAPVLPDESSTSLRDLAMTLMIFLVGGVFMSVVGILGTALLDRSFRFPVDVQMLLELPVIAYVPIENQPLPWYRRLFGRSKKKSEEAAPKTAVPAPALATNMNREEMSEAAA